jgi:hypothetical protein
MIRDFISFSMAFRIGVQKVGLWLGRWRIAREFAVYKYLKDGQK